MLYRFWLVAVTVLPYSKWGLLTIVDLLRCYLVGLLPRPICWLEQGNTCTLVGRKQLLRMHFSQPSSCWALSGLTDLEIWVCSLRHLRLAKVKWKDHVKSPGAVVSRGAQGAGKAVWGLGSRPEATARSSPSPLSWKVTPSTLLWFRTLGKKKWKCLKKF